MNFNNIKAVLLSNIQSTLYMCKELPLLCRGLILVQRFPEHKQLLMPAGALERRF